jgi:nitrate reductase NapE component
MPYLDTLPTAPDDNITASVPRHNRAVGMSDRSSLLLHLFVGLVLFVIFGVAWGFVVGMDVPRTVMLAENGTLLTTSMNGSAE